MGFPKRTERFRLGMLGRIVLGLRLLLRAARPEGRSGASAAASGRCKSAPHSSIPKPALMQLGDALLKALTGGRLIVRVATPSSEMLTSMLRRRRLRSMPATHLLKSSSCAIAAGNLGRGTRGAWRPEGCGV